MWRELFRTRHYDGAYHELSRLTDALYTRRDFEAVHWPPVRIDGHEACSAYESRDGRFRVVADVDRRGNSVRVVQERR